MLCGGGIGVLADDRYARATMKPPKQPIAITLLAATVPATFILIILGSAVRDRVLPGEVSGALVALLGVLAASTFAYYESHRRKDDPDE